MKAKCFHCEKNFEIMAGHYNRAMKAGYGVYCSRKHSGLARRSGKTKAQKKQAKAAYDSLYRSEHAAALKLAKAAYFKKDYATNPKKYLCQRKKRQKWQNEYCRHPEYRKWKKEYDRTYRAKKHYGPIADIFLVWLDLRNEIDNRFAKTLNNIQNKSQKRKRSCQKQIPKNQLSSLL